MQNKKIPQSAFDLKATSKMCITHIIHTNYMYNEGVILIFCFIVKLGS